MAALLMAKRSIAIFTFMTIALVLAANANENIMPGLRVILFSNKSKELQPSENIQLDFELTTSPESLKLQNFLLVIEVPYPALTVISATSQYRNNSESLHLNKTTSHLNVTYASLMQKAKVSLVVEASKSLESQAILMIKYKIQYLVNATYTFSFSKALTTRSLSPYLQQSITIEPRVVAAEDLLNISLAITSNNVATGTYNVALQVKIANTFASKASCSPMNSTFGSMKNDTISILFGNFTRLQNISCSIQVTVGSNIELGGQLKFTSILSYYHKEPHKNLYPINNTVTRYVNISSIGIMANASSNLSSLQAGEVFQVSLIFLIPRSTSIVNVTIKLPTYRMSSSNISEPSSVISSSGKGISYSFGSGITNKSVPLIRMVNLSVLNVYFGLIKSNGSIKASMEAASIRMLLSFQVKNNPLDVFGIQTHLSVIVGNSVLQIPLSITGPVLYPALLVEKSAKILDANRNSPLISFTIVVKHSNASKADAVNVRVVDSTENMEIHSQAIAPFGKLELKLSSLYILMINGVIDRLRVSENATISYTGSFTSSYKSSSYRRRATVSWQSIQANNAKVLVKHSQEVCLSATKRSIVEYKKSYTMVLLGIVAGILFGVLFGLLVIFCLRKFKIAKKYVLTDTKEEDECEGAEDISANGDHNKFIPLNVVKKSLGGNQLKADQRAEMQKLKVRSWALMIASKYDRTSVETSCSRNLVELLVKGHDNSICYFIDSLLQAVNTFARRLRLTGDLSAENLQKIQLKVDQVNHKFNQDSEALKRQFMSSNDGLQEVGKNYLEFQCSLIQAAKKDCEKLFHSIFDPPSKAEKDQTEEMKGDFADLERTAFMHANGLRAQSYSHVKQNQISQVGYLHILIWSQKVFGLWCQWVSKKLRRELDILQRKRSITELDTNTLSSNIDYIFKEGLISYEDELHRRAIILDKELYSDFSAFDKTLESDLRSQLKAIRVEPSQMKSKSQSDALEIIKQRHDLFVNKINLYLEKHDEHLNEEFEKTLDLIRNVTLDQLKEITGNIELLVVKYFSQNPASDEQQQQHHDNDVLQQGSEKALKKQSMKTLLECLEDIQADLEEAQNTNDAIVDDFREEIQSARENCRQMASSILQETDKLIDEPIVQCRFQFKSLLYFLRDLSLPKVKSFLESWSKHLQLILTGVFMLRDLKNFAEIAPEKMENTEEENVIYWFKPIGSITSSQFQRTKKTFAHFVEGQAHELSGLFQDQTECLRNLAKDDILMDLKEDRINITKMSSLKQEFLIVHQYIAHLLNEFTNEQQLNDPEVEDCFIKFDKAVRLLLAKGDEDQESSREQLKKEIHVLMSDFKRECESMHAQTNLGACAKAEEMLFDEDRILHKIEKMISSKKNENEKINILKKLQNENLKLLANLRKIDKINYSEFMQLVNVLHSNLPKTRFDEILVAIEGNSERNYCNELNSYLANEERSKEQENDEKRAQLLPNKRKQNRKKLKTIKKNAIGPEA